jgi:hypothetical protein
MGVQKYGVLSKWQNIDRKNYLIPAINVDITLRDNKKNTRYGFISGIGW